MPEVQEENPGLEWSDFTVCKSPPELAGLPIKELKVTDFQCQCKYFLLSIVMIHKIWWFTADEKTRVVNRSMLIVLVMVLVGLPCALLLSYIIPSKERSSSVQQGQSRAQWYVWRTYRLQLYTVHVRLHSATTVLDHTVHAFSCQERPQPLWSGPSGSGLQQGVFYREGPCLPKVHEWRRRQPDNRNGGLIQSAGDDSHLSLFIFMLRDNIKYW